MNKGNKYFQFPIAALHFGKPISEVNQDEMKCRLSKIINYCIIEVGLSLVSNAQNDDDATVAVDSMVTRQAEIMNVDPNDATDNQRILLCGACQLNVNPGGLEWKPRADAHKEIVNRSHRHGSQLCRLRSDILWDCKEGHDWTWRELSTLVAVYAGIGRYQRAKLTYDRIGAMALGFNGQRQRDAYNQAANQLTERQTRRTVNTLRERELFISASPNGRHVFYSHRLSLDQLIDSLAAESPKAKLSASDITKAIKERAAERSANAQANLKGVS